MSDCNLEENVWAYCAMCGVRVDMKMEEYLARTHPVFKCKKCEAVTMCPLGMPDEHQNPYIVRYCLVKKKLTFMVSCAVECPYWKEYTDPKLTKDQLEAIIKQWNISGYCTNANKTTFKTIPCLVDKVVCDACKPEEYQEERARELMQKDCLPVKKTMVKKVVQRKLF